MTQTITHIMIISSLIIFGVALIICLFGLIKGPTIVDRVVTLDTTSAVVMSIVGILSVLMGTVSLLNLIMLTAIIFFISSVPISRLIGGGYVFNGNNKRNF